jgi:hypothetical protein
MRRPAQLLPRWVVAGRTCLQPCSQCDAVHLVVLGLLLLGVIRLLCCCRWLSSLQAAGSAAAAGLNTTVYAEAAATAYALGGAQAQVRLWGYQVAASGFASTFHSRSRGCEKRGTHVAAGCQPTPGCVAAAACVGLLPGIGTGFQQWWLPGRC